MPRTATARPLHTRSRYARTNGDLLLNDGKEGPAVWWWGTSAGGLSQPIGPNGPWTDGKGGVPAVTRATSLITDPIAQVPWYVRQEGRPNWVPRWLADPMLLRPDERVATQAWPHLLRRPRASFWADWVRQALWWGMGVLIFQETATGEPKAGTLYLLHRWGFDCIGGDGQGQPRLKIGDEYETDADGRWVSGGVQWRSVVLRHPHSPVDEQGRSFGVFDQHPDLFRLQADLGSYSSSQFRTGIPAGYLKANQPGLSQRQADDLKAAWMKAHGGSERSVAVLNATTEFTALSRTPVDLALVDVEKASLVGVANAFGMDPSMIGGPSGDSSTYANVTQRYAQFRVHTLGRWQVDVEETLNALLPYGQDVEVDLDRLLRPDTSTRFDQYGKALDSGWLTKDEVRALEGLPPLPKVQTPPPLPAPEERQPEDDTEDQQEEESNG